MSNTVDVDLGGSSRSASPASDDIDFDDSQQRQQEQLLRSPVSPQRAAPHVNLFDQPRTAGTSRQTHAGSKGGHGQTIKRRAGGGGGGSRHDMQFSEAHGGGRGGSISNIGGLMDPSQASAFDKLLDLNYLRDYGDPVARYDAMLKQSGTSQALQSSGETDKAPKNQVTDSQA